MGGAEHRDRPPSARRAHAARRAPTLLSLAFAATASAGCLLANGPRETVVQPARAAVSPDPRGLVGGVEEVDLTPPPGLPTYGYSSNGASSAVGYWLRIKGRIIVLQKGAQRIAMIQADLGASSGLVHRMLAAALADAGFDPSNIMLSTTHTHGGPGGFFGEKFFNQAIGARPAYIPEYARFLTTRLEGGVRKALSAMRPAKIGFAQTQAHDSVTFNRSIEAWRTNFTGEGVGYDDSRSVDRTLTLLRVDLDDKPAAAWSVFAVHGTAMPAGYPFFHGDVHGLASRFLAHFVKRKYGAEDFVAAMATGAEGDVSPGTPHERQGKELLFRVATGEAGSAFLAFESLNEKMRDDLELGVAYAERPLRGAQSSRGPLCNEASLGGSEAAGSEASQGPLNGFLEMVEGAVGPDVGCQGTKIHIFGAIQDAVFDPAEFPDITAFQTFTFGRPEGDASLVLAAVPGEPTTETGHTIIKNIRSKWTDAMIAPVGLTNSYSVYLTMPAEYSAQHYEGGTTPYGPFQGLYVAEELGRLASSIAERNPTIAFSSVRHFSPGAAKPIWPQKGACAVAKWRALSLEFRPGSSPLANPRLNPKLAVFHWQGMAADEACELAHVSVECAASAAPGTDPQYHPFVDRDGYAATDEGDDFEVGRDGDDTWFASWTMRAPPPDTPTATCRFVVNHPALSRPLVSEPFAMEEQ